MTVPLATDWAEVLVPPIWSAVLIVGLVLLIGLFKRPIGRVLRELGLSNLKILGIDMEDIVSETKDAYSKRDRDAPGEGELRAFARLSGQLAPLVRERRVLWVDDEPDNNEVEARLLRRLGVEVENALGTEEALARLRRDPARFDLVVSDWRRGGDADAGRTLLEALGGSRRRLPVLMYVGEADERRRAEAAALGAKALTDEPDELLKQVLVELATAV
jgi:CheY-like chemotaxis protein